MPDWIKVAVDLTEHPKFIRLRRKLGISEDETIGLLFRLWRLTFRYAPDGDLSALDPQEIADACSWSGDDKALLAALCEPRNGSPGFLERQGKRLLVHDWPDFSGQLHLQRQAGRDRQAKYRSTKGDTRDVLVTSQKAKRGHNGDVPVTSRARREERLIDKKVFAAQQHPESAQQPVDNSAGKRSVGPDGGSFDHPPCAICGQVLTAQELADEKTSVFTSSGYQHRKCLLPNEEEEA